MLAVCTMVAAFIVLGVSLVRDTAHARSSKAAADSLASMTLRLDDAHASALAGAADAQAYLMVLDSLRAHPHVDTVYARRQYTPVIVDTGDVQSVAMALVMITAERDTAIIDRDSARAQVVHITAELLALDSLGIVHARADSVRFAQITATLDTVQHEAHALIALVRPRWYRRWGGVVVRSAKVASVAVIAYTLGRIR